MIGLIGDRENIGRQTYLLKSRQIGEYPLDMRANSIGIE
jgi:hypothetical protein